MLDGHRVPGYWLSFAAFDRFWWLFKDAKVFSKALNCCLGHLYTNTTLQSRILCKNLSYESWVVPAGVGSALAYVLRAEADSRQIISNN